LGIDHVRSLSGEGEASGILLETTQSALALPLIARGQVFGVITLQSRSPTAYRNEDLVSLRGVADQVATAISNAQLAQELQARIRAMEILQQYYVREEWEEFLGSHQNLWYEYDQPGISALEEDSTPQVNRVLAHPQLTVLDAADDAEAPAALLSPISLRDQVLGVLGFHEMDRDKEWTEDQIELVAAVAQQLGLIIENSRLFAEARSRAARERTVREITARVRQSLDLDTVLQTAVWEMGEALNLQDITVHLGVDDLEASEE
jgi:GAF domain-containing protein